MSSRLDTGTGTEGRGRSAGARSADELGLAAGSAWSSTTWAPNSDPQRRVLACERGVVLAIGGIGAGKSEAAALRLLTWALRHPRRADGNPTRWFVVGPEFSLIRSEQFPKILAHARRIRELGYRSVVRRVVYGQDPRIVLRDGQVLIGRSGDQPRRMDGHEVDGAWIDEAHRQPEKAFTTALSRMRSSDDVRCVVSANPEDAPGWLWRAISGEDVKYNELRAQLAKSGGGFRVFRWGSVANTANTGDVLDVISAALDAGERGASGAKLSGLFPGTHELPSLAATEHGRAFVGRIELRGEEARPAVLAVDIGETVDFTVLTVMSARGVQLAVERWNAGSPGVPRATFYPWAEDRIIAVARQWNVKLLIIDTAKAGKPIAQSIERKVAAGSAPSGVKVIAYDTSSPRKKSDAITAYLLALSKLDARAPSAWTLAGREVAVDHVTQLQKELEELVRIESENGRVAYDHPPGGHDDCVVSGALAWHALSQGGSQAASAGNYAGWTHTTGGGRRM